MERMKVRREGELKDTNRYIFTFNRISLPSSIRVTDWYYERIETYIPRPYRCIKCQRFGHTKRHCNRTEVCSKCSMEGHTSQSCNNNPFCVNCRGPHDSRSKDCPTLRFKSEVLATQAREHITYREAEEKTREKLGIGGRSYSSVVRAPQPKAHGQQTRPSQLSNPIPPSADEGGPDRGSVPQEGENQIGVISREIGRKSPDRQTAKNREQPEECPSSQQNLPSLLSPVAGPSSPSGLTGPTQSALREKQQHISPRSRQDVITSPNKKNKPNSKNKNQQIKSSAPKAQAQTLQVQGTPSLESKSENPPNQQTTSPPRLAALALKAQAQTLQVQGTLSLESKSENPPNQQITSPPRPASQQTPERYAATEQTGEIKSGKVREIVEKHNRKSLSEFKIPRLTKPTIPTPSEKVGVGARRHSGDAGKGERLSTPSQPTRSYSFSTGEPRKQRRFGDLKPLDHLKPLDFQRTEWKTVGRGETKNLKRQLEVSPQQGEKKLKHVSQAREIASSNRFSLLEEPNEENKTQHISVHIGGGNITPAPQTETWDIPD